MIFPSSKPFAKNPLAELRAAGYLQGRQFALNEL